MNELLIQPEREELEEGSGPFLFHPLPVPARCCGTILQATYAEANRFRCPTCGEMVCYTCGCTDDHACVSTVTSADGEQSATYACSWNLPGICSFCYSRAAYEFYQEATARAADDPFYMSRGHSVREVKGLGWGIG